MTKMAPMVKHFENLLSKNHWADFDETLYEHQRPKPFIFCSNYETGLTLTYFMIRSNFPFIWLNVKMMDLWKLLHPVTWNLVNIVN